MALLKASAAFRWPNAIVPYEIDYTTLSLFDFAALGELQAAFNEWQKATPIVFVNKTDEHSDYVRIMRDWNKTRCDSVVGRIGGPQSLTCGASPTRKSFAHELGHAIGFFHEQQRPDRDAMVAVSAVALREEPQNFERRDDELMPGPYDFASALHYPMNATATDRLTLTRLHPDPAKPSDLPSDGDLAAVRFMYGIVPMGTPIAVHSRHTNHMETWVVDGDGQLIGAWFDGQWQSWYRLPGRAFPTRAHLAVVSRHANHMEIFGIGTDGRLHGRWFDDTWRNWFTLGAPRLLADLPDNTPPIPPGAPLTALSRSPNHMEVWVVGSDNRLHGTWFDGTWQGWYPLEGRRFPAGARVVSLSRNPNHMEVLAIGEDGRLHGNWWEGSWRGWYTLDGAGVPNLVPGGGLAALTRNDDHMEVWSIGTDDRLHGIWFDGDWRSWYPLGAPAGTAFAPGAPVTASKKHDDHMEVWCVSDANRLAGIWWDGDWRTWYPPDDQLALPRAAPLASISRHANHMEVWCVGPENPNPAIPGVQGVWFDGNWHPFYRVV